MPPAPAAFVTSMALRKVMLPVVVVRVSAANAVAESAPVETNERRGSTNGTGKR